MKTYSQKDFEEFVYNVMLCVFNGWNETQHENKVTEILMTGSLSDICVSVYRAGAISFSDIGDNSIVRAFNSSTKCTGLRIVPRITNNIETIYHNHPTGWNTPVLDVNLDISTEELKFNLMLENYSTSMIACTNVLFRLIKQPQFKLYLNKCIVLNCTTMMQCFINHTIFREE